jgi:hypothetical protein
MKEVTLEIQLLVSNGYGWEDAYVRLLNKGLITSRDKQRIRAYVMSLHPRVKQRVRA